MCRPPEGGRHSVVMRSTVPPGTGASLVAPRFSGEQAPDDWTVGTAMCPEFLREGHGVSDFNEPPFVVVGADELAALLSQGSELAVAAAGARSDAEAAAQTPGQPSPYRRLAAFPSLMRTQTTSELLSSLTRLENERGALMVVPSDMVSSMGGLAAFAPAAFEATMPRVANAASDEAGA